MSLPFIIVSGTAAILIIVLTLLNTTLWLAAVALAYIAFAVVVMGMRTNKTDKTNKIEVAERTAEEIILEVLKTNGQAQRRDFLKAVKLSRTSLGRVLDEMENQGLIEQRGENRGSYYVLKSLS